MATEEQVPELDDSLNDIDMTGLLAKLDEVPEEPAPPPAPAAPEPAVVAPTSQNCPAGTPKPKINLDALKKSARATESTADAQVSVGRMFGGDTAVPPPLPANDNVEEVESEEVASEPLPEKPLPKPLIWLDLTTERIRRVHPLIPTALGIVGGICLINGLIILALASLAWI